MERGGQVQKEKPGAWHRDDGQITLYSLCTLTIYVSAHLYEESLFVEEVLTL